MMHRLDISSIIWLSLSTHSRLRFIPRVFVFIFSFFTFHISINNKQEVDWTRILGWPQRWFYFYRVWNKTINNNNNNKSDYNVFFSLLFSLYFTLLWLAGFGKSMTIEIEVSAFTILYGGIIRSMYLQGKWGFFRSFKFKEKLLVSALFPCI